MIEKPVLIIDGLNLFTRHFVVNPTMSQNGHHLGGFVGFLKGIRLLSERCNPEQIVVVWEGGGSSRRRAIFSDYKQGRRPQKLNRYYDDIPDTIGNRNRQVALLVEALKHVPVRQMYVTECEADDAIAYMTRYHYRDKKCVIVSSDKDLYQLIDERVTQWSPGQKAYITSEKVKEKFGISVSNFVTARAFTGDPSDGIKGVPHAGFKSLAKRFPELAEEDHVSVREVVGLARKLSETKKLKILNAIVENEEVASTNWKLMYLDITNLSAQQIEKIKYCLDSFEPRRNKIALMRMLAREGVNNFDVDSYYIAIKNCK